MKPIAGLSIIAAVALNQAIGNKNSLLWKLPSDLKRFKAITSGHPVIMGRRTWESIPKKFRPLSERTNVVLTRRAGYQAFGASVTSSLEDALAAAMCAVGSREIFVMGGADLYAQCLPIASALYVTRVHASFAGDAFFPAFEMKEWFTWEARSISQAPGDEYPTSFEKLRRRSS